MCYLLALFRVEQTNCRSTVVQRGESYKMGLLPHICQPKTGASLANKISTQVKLAATQRVFDSAAQTVEEVKIYNSGVSISLSIGG